MPSQFVVARFDDHGALDPTFDSDGRATVAFGDQPAVAEDVAVKTVGTIVAIGSAWAPDSLLRKDFAIAFLPPAS